ncbi:MAG: tRNA 2-selenouridine [Bacteroidetes bacterium]|nr:MAG: tRNA 2-selenouridine [Bacteroidota bacterium]
MVNSVTPSWFFNSQLSVPLIDVRSPSEFAQGHISGAVNIPLFSDTERAEIGTLYKNAGKEAALFLGLDRVGPNMSGFVKKLNAISRGKTREVVVYCWRGGMRSASMAWLFSTAGFQVHLIEGGYKNLRTYIRAESGKNTPMIVLGGMTGSGKTEILHELKKRGEQIIDLEDIAHNKGSVFGYLGQLPQPTNEQFENNLFAEWIKLDHTKRIWIEDESRSVGAVGLPAPFFDHMKKQPLILLNVTIEKRVERLVNEYAGFDKNLLLEALAKISQAMGGQGVTEAKKDIQDGDFAPAIKLVLEYYDKTYRKALEKFKSRKITEFDTHTGDAKENAEQILKLISGNNELNYG